MSLVRLPEGLDGERFFQKHLGVGFPAGLRPVKIAQSNGTMATYMYVTSVAGLVGAAQMGTLEFHIWGSRRDKLERPDRMVFDLDPDETLGFQDVVKSAIDIRDKLATFDLQSWSLVTGGKGVHVIVPLRRTVSWETVKLFSKVFANVSAAREPDRYTAEISKAKRKGRIFIDWLRNERGSTAIAPFSLRARPGAPVAIPVGWKELPKLHSAADFKLEKALKRSWNNLKIPAPVGLTQRRIDLLGVWAKDVGD